jgi:Lectin C-type domain
VRLRLNILAGAVAASVGACVAMAGLAPAGCIPDLPTDEPVDGAVEASGGRCGDGIIQLRSEQCDPGDAVSPECSKTCQMVCPQGGFVWKGQNNHCYYLKALNDAGAGAATITEATGVCSEDNPQTTHLVTFASLDELVAVQTSFPGVGTYWVGLTEGFDAVKYAALAAYEPGWAPTCPGCYANTPDASQPLPGPSDAGCVRGSPGSSWGQFACTGTVPPSRPAVICEREPLGRTWTTCDAGYCIDVPFTYPTKSYVYVHAGLSPEMAELACRTMGGTLVVLQSRDEREQIWKQLALTPNVPLDVWIGLSLSDGGVPANPASWIWDDDAGGTTYPSPWAVGEPHGPATRGYLNNTTATPIPIDNTLAHSHSAVMSSFDYVCQLLSK